METKQGIRRLISRFRKKYVVQVAALYLLTFALHKQWRGFPWTERGKSLEGYVGGREGRAKDFISEREICITTARARTRA